MKTKAPFLSTLLLAMSFAGLAAAQDPPPYTPPPPAAPMATATTFGGPGQLVISDDITLAFIHQSQTMTDQSANEFQLQPAVDYFVSPNLSVGGQLSIRYSSLDDGSGNSASTTLVGVLPRIGYNIPIAPTVSLWPRLALGYVHASTDLGGGLSASGYTVTLEVFAPVLFHPVPHFFVGAGPIFTTDLISKVEGEDASKTTNIGLLSTIGGYFGGT